MPRAAQSPAAGILQFFRTASLEAATQLLDLCRAEVRGRIGKSQAAKARAVAPPAPAPATAADRPKRKVKARKATVKGAGRAAKAPVQTVLPDPGPGAEAGEAGDAPQA